MCKSRRLDYSLPLSLPDHPLAPQPAPPTGSPNRLLPPRDFYLSIAFLLLPGITTPLHPRLPVCIALAPQDNSRLSVHMPPQLLILQASLLPFPPTDPRRFLPGPP